MKEINGHILSGTPICVDHWLWKPKGKYYHFLTHLHSDHTVNLKSTFREPIYTSPFNAWLLRRWFGMSLDVIKPLDIGGTHLFEEGETRFAVTLLDANHCPGSVMFLFQGDFGNILYTGDFRYNLDMLHNPTLKSLIENDAVDKLYLDNTYAAEHCQFPTREEALKDLIDVIRKHPDHTILIGVRKLGKEEVIRAIALELNEKVCVSEDRKIILTKMAYENVITTQTEESRIFIVLISQINQRFIDKVREKRGPVFAILLTALYNVEPPDAKGLPMFENVKGILKIPYSDHSSHSELVDFVSKIKPKEILPIISTSLNNVISARKEQYPTEIVCCAWQNSIIPKSILKYCRTAKTLNNFSLADSKQYHGFKNKSFFNDNVISYKCLAGSEKSFKKEFKDLMVKNKQEKPSQELNGVHAGDEENLGNHCNVQSVSTLTNKSKSPTFSPIIKKIKPSQIFDDSIDLPTKYHKQPRLKLTTRNNGEKNGEIVPQNSMVKLTAESVPGSEVKVNREPAPPCSAVTETLANQDKDAAKDFLDGIRLLHKKWKEGFKKMNEDL